MPVYRYKFTGVLNTELAREVVGATTTGVSTAAIFQDVTAAAGDKPDLDAAMAVRGWTYFSQDPVTTVDQQAEVVSAAVRKLVDFIGAPAEGYSSGVYRTITMGVVAPSAVTWWTNNTATTKIYEVTYTRNAAQCATTTQYKVYDTDGTTVLATVTDSITYDGSGIIEQNRTRTIA